MQILFHECTNLTNQLHSLNTVLKNKKKMPWETCAVHGCSTSRKDRGVGIFKLPGDYLKPQEEWRNKIVDVFRNRRGFDSFLEAILNDTARICELHFRECDVETYTLPHVYPARRRIKTDAIPCRKLPPPLPHARPKKTLDKKGRGGSLSSGIIIVDHIIRKRKNYEIEPPPLPKRKFRTIGVDTREDIRFRHFSCQVGESFMQRKKKNRPAAS